MNNTDFYNPFVNIFDFTCMYRRIIVDELTNDNAIAYYAQGWDAHKIAIAQLKEFTLDGFENHAQACIAVFGPCLLIAIAAYHRWNNRNAPRLMPASQTVSIAGLATHELADTVFNTSWIDWKTYLELILMREKGQ